MSSVTQTQRLCLGNVPVDVISMEIVLMEGAPAFLDFMVMIVVDVSSISHTIFQLQYSFCFYCQVIFFLQQIFVLLSFIRICYLNLFQVPAPAVALAMACVSPMECVNVKRATLALIVQPVNSEVLFLTTFSFQDCISYNL